MSQSLDKYTFPLSFNQQQLWLLDQLEGGVSTAYNLVYARRLLGALDRASLEQSLNAIMRRHDVLRTRIASVQGEPIQIISESTRFPLQFFDCESMDDDDPSGDVHRMLQQEMATPFDLQVGPLVRGRLLRMSDREHVLIVGAHHIIWDGWSIGVFDNELKTFYQAFASNSDAELRALPVQYSDFVRQQRQWTSSKAFREQIDYWKEYLAPPLPEMELPLQLRRPTEESFEGKTFVSTLDEALSQKLKSLSRNHRSSLYVTMLTGFFVLLYRYTEQEDLVLGTVTANRSQAEYESLIGFFANTLVVRASLRADSSFLDLLKAVRSDVFNMLDRGAMPFERLVSELQPERSRGRFPIIQLMFVLENPPRISEMSDIVMEPISVKSDVTKFDLSVAVSEVDNRLQCTFNYSAELFEADSIDRMSGHYRRILEGIVADPDSEIRTLPILTEEERNLILFDWNTTSADWPRGRCIHDLFEAQVLKTPDAVALVFGGEALTYRELNGLSNGLAFKLRSIGIGPERTVGICTKRSFEMVIGLLAILKAGGAYVPIDPDYPSSRKVYMMENSESTVILLQRDLSDGFPDGSWGKLILESCIHKTVDTEPDSNQYATQTSDKPLVGSENLAYIIYTSGSTGNPKGVCVEHRNVVQFVINNNQASITRDDSVLQISPLTFDGSVLQIWGALLNGAKLLIAPAEMPTVGELGAFIRNSGITIVNMTAGLFHLLVDERLTDLTAVRHFIVGGEVLSPPHIQAVLDELPNAVMSNAYGPTETTVTATSHNMSHGYKIEASVPIGRPISNATAYVLDTDFEPVPMGVLGELVIGGDGVARGYMNAPELTAERFIHDPFSAHEGARMYRTGDRCRWMKDGVLEYVGRIDNQLKIRGFRVEPGEIEAALEHHEIVRESVVLGRDEAQGTKKLVAYIVPNTSKDADSDTLREYLEKLLPSYMVPSAFVMLDKLPLTPTGKINRDALPEPKWTPAQLDETQDKSLSPTEKIIAEFWITLLELERVGADDHFFRLGGNSLQAMRLLARISDLFKIDLPLRSIFDAPKLRDFALLVDNTLDESK